ncbi:MAG: cohesin domain-containing protein [Nitrospira sp.]|nr:cohesin domain-containing protein [Nitrospira sp.]MCP9461675.1 cohesin domain-containing protein [Nitrospira sp.]MCP9473709.1 cohesin domain-containing protein [Nitrospira sp.]
MWQSMQKKSLSWLLRSGLIGLVVLCAPHQGQALTVTVGSAAVSVGDTVSLNVNVVDAVNLTSWQFDLGYDPTILHADLVAEGPFLSSAGGTLFSPGIIDNSTGLISLISDSFVDLTPPSGSGVLASIQFTALSLGLSPVTMSNVFLNFTDSGFAVTNGSVTVVPLPGTAGLMGVGLLLFWGFGRWNRPTKAAV